MNRGTICIVTVLVALRAEAGNDHTFPIGGRAAGMAGAYVAMAEEASVAWHNPAGLGFNERYSLDVSASAFFLQAVRVRDLVRTYLPSGCHDAPFNVISFQVVPTSMTYSYRIGKPSADATTAHSVAFSVFVPRSEKFSKSFALDSVETEPRSGVEVAYHQKIHMQRERTQYYLGPSWGMRLGRNLAFGASLFLTYFLESLRSGFDMDILSPSGQNYFFINQGDFTTTTLGLAPVLGAQFRAVSEKLRLGVTLRLPPLRFSRSAQGSRLNAHTMSPQSNNFFEQYDLTLSEWKLKVAGPFRATFGAAWAEQKSFTVAMDVDLVGPFKDQEAGIAERFRVNGRLGAEILVGTRYAVSAGLFTDLAPEREGTGLAESRVDFIGGTAAFSFLSPYDVTGSEKTDRITFSTTLGLKYAFGFGKVMGLELDPLLLKNQGAVQRVVARKIFVHDVSVIVGSSIIF